MKKFILTSLLASCVLFMGQGESLSMEWKLYTSKDSVFTISYPVNWEYVQNRNFPFFREPVSGSSVSVFIFDLSKYPMSLEDYMKLTRRTHLEQRFKVLVDEPTIFNNEEARRYDYEGMAKDKFLRFKSYIFIKNNKAFTVEYMSFPSKYEQHLIVAEQVMKSIVINN